MNKIKAKEIGVFVVIVSIIAISSIVLAGVAIENKKGNAGGSEGATYSDDITKLDTTVGDKVSDMINHNAYVQVQVGPDNFVYFVYNKKGEAIIESSLGGIEFKKHNNESLLIGDNDVKMEITTDPLKEIVYMNSLFEPTVETEEDGSVVHVFTANGDEEVKKLYDCFSEGYGEQIVNILKNDALSGLKGESQSESQSENQSEKETTDNKENESETESKTESETVDANITEIKEEPIQVQIVITTFDGEQEIFNAYKKVKLKDGSEFYDWAFSGYYELGDWELPESWYGDIKSEPIADVHSEAEKVLKRMDINMLKMMDGLKEIVPNLETADKALADYFDKSDEEKDTLINAAIADLDKCMYVIDVDDKSKIKEELEKLKDDQDFNDISIMLGVMYVGDSNGWLAVKQTQQDETAGNDITSQTNLSEEELSKLANEAIQKSMQEDNVGNGSTVTAE